MYVKCSYCNEFIEYHHHKHHEEKCLLRDENLKVIIDYYIDNIHTKKTTSNELMRLCKKHKILTPFTIRTRLGFKTWKESLYQLFIYGYLKNFADFELLDFILYRLEFYKQVSANKIQDDYTDNYELLLKAIINRAKEDLLSDKYIDDNDKQLCENLCQEFNLLVI